MGDVSPGPITMFRFPRLTATWWKRSAAEFSTHSVCWQRDIKTWVEQGLRDTRVRAALQAASQGLTEAASRGDQAAILAAARYMTRMATRPTPFGLLAGYAVGRPSGLQADSVDDRWDVLPSIDYAALVPLLHELEDVLQEQLKYRVTPYRWMAGSKWRFGRIAVVDGRLIHELASVVKTPPLVWVSNTVTEFMLHNDIVDGLKVKFGGSDGEIREFVDELVQKRFLLSELGPDIMSSNIESSVASFVERLPCQEFPQWQRLAGLLKTLPGVDEDKISDATKELSDTAFRICAHRGHTVNIVLKNTTPGLTIHDDVIRELDRVGRELVKINGTFHDPDLEQFKERFRAKYHRRTVPLLEALDPEFGIGFREAGTVIPWSAGAPKSLGASRDKFLISRLGSASPTYEGDREWKLTGSDLEQLATRSGKFPSGFAYFGRLLSSSAQAVSRGDFRVVLHSIVGPPGTRLLGRFAARDVHLQDALKECLRQEAENFPEAIVAEVAHLPTASMGNAVHRPQFTEYVIDALGAGRNPKALPLTDLSIRVEGGRIRLESRTLQCEVRPRLSSALNYKGLGNMVSSFLCSLQSQDGALPVWSWGAANDLPFTPRVRLHRTILYPARWRIPWEEAQDLIGVALEDPARVAATLRNDFGMPDDVALVTGDQWLSMDLRYPATVGIALSGHPHGQQLVMQESFLQDDMLLFRAPDGSRVVHEFVQPMARVANNPEHRTAPLATIVREQSRKRALYPRDECLYVAVPVGVLGADEFLVNLGKWIDPLVLNGSIQSWFFIRYGFPDWHVRLRFFGEPDSLWLGVFPALMEELRLWESEGSIGFPRLGTYIREVERYGGWEGISRCERIFFLDSCVVCNSIESSLRSPPVARLQARWKWAHRSVHRIIQTLPMSIQERVSYLENARDLRLGAMFGWDQRSAGRRYWRRTMGKRWRDNRGWLELIEGVQDGDDLQVIPFDEWEESFLSLRKHREQTGNLASCKELWMSLIHMHLNRLLPSAHAEAEAALFDGLSKVYRAAIGRRHDPFSRG